MKDIQRKEEKEEFLPIKLSTRNTAFIILLVIIFSVMVWLFITPRLHFKRSALIYEKSSIATSLTITRKSYGHDSMSGVTSMSFNIPYLSK